MFFPGISSQIRRQCLLPSSAGQDQSLAQIAGVEPVRARRTPARIGPPKARSMPRFHAFSNWRFFDMFAPPSTETAYICKDCQQVLARGYSITMDAGSGWVIRAARQTRAGQKLRMR